MKSLRYGKEIVLFKICIYKKSIYELVTKIENQQFSLLDEEDIIFLNEIFRRHKYSQVISDFLKAKQKYEVVSTTEAIRRYPEFFSRYWKTKKMFQ